MVEITDAEWEELQALRLHHRRQLELEAVEGLTLEADIDLPIRRCVAAFALLGCEPTWSCCGFDYVGQPIHKWHQYGRTFFILGGNSRTLAVVGGFVEGGGRKEGWTAFYPTPVGTLDLHNDFVNVVPEWGYNPCFHYYEPAVIKIQLLESYLMSLKEFFADEVIIRDTNGLYRAEFAYWQYPPRGDWLIRKADL